MREITDIVKTFRPITLEEMECVRLMNRIDTKYVATVPQLCQLLSMAKDDYRAQQICGRRLMPYYTRYYDTPDCRMYVAHECGQAARQKVRLRVYEDSQTAFLEVKTKDNHGRTHKERKLVNAGYELAHYKNFLESCSPFHADGLTEQLENRFNRLTLVNNNMTERLTIDTSLRFHNIMTDERRWFDQLVIIELKRDGRVASPITALLRDLHIHPCGFSKYCMGMALTNEHLRHNRLKPRMRRILAME